MPDFITTFSRLVAEQVIEIGAGRPRTVSLKGHNLPVLRVADVLDGRIESATLVHASSQDVNIEEPKVSRAGDIVLTTKGTVGRVALMPSGGPVFAYSPQLCYFRPAAHGPLRSRFLYYWFKSAEFWSQAEALKGQTDMADFLSLGDVQLMRIRIPSLERQDAVASVLGALDDKLASNGLVVKLADELATALTRAALEEQTVDLATIAAVTMGSSPPGATYNEEARGVPFYQGVRDFGTRFPDRRVWTTSPVRVAIPGDTLVSVRAPVGRTNLVNEQMCIGRGVASLRSRDGHPYTLFHRIRLANDAWAPYEAEGTVFGSINRKQLEKVSVSTISPGVDDVLEGHLSAVEHRIAAALYENRLLTKMRDELLPLLMSGRIRVKDAEKVVEEVV